MKGTTTNNDVNISFNSIAEVVNYIDIGTKHFMTLQYSKEC